MIFSAPRGIVEARGICHKMWCLGMDKILPVGSFGRNCARQNDSRANHSRSNDQRDVATLSIARRSVSAGHQGIAATTLDQIKPSSFIVSRTGGGTEAKREEMFQERRSRRSRMANPM
jgi:hypothetical protein